MKTKKTKFFWVLFAISSLVMAVDAPKAKVGRDINFMVGLNLGYHSTPVKIGPTELENTLDYSFAALEVDFELLDFLTLGVVAGYNRNSFQDAVNFDTLPLSVQLGDTATSSMLLGVRARAELFSIGDVTVNANAEALLFKLFEKDYAINLPIVTGTATVKHNFTRLGAELLVNYEGIDNFRIFAGPRVNLVNGTVTTTETIENISAEEELTYEQENLIGAVAGITYQVTSQIDLGLKVYLVSETAFSLAVVYAL